MSDEERRQGRDTGLRTIEPEELARILEEHEKWLESEGKGIREGNRAELFRVDLRGHDLIDINLRKASLLGVCLEGQFLGEADLQGASLREADLKNANLGRANLAEAIFEDANLQQAVLDGANLQSARFRRADLGGAYLWDANLQDAKLPQARLKAANLHLADFTGATLFDADLTSAKLRGAKLARANLQNAKLVGANLSNADISGADLRYADLTDAILLDATPLAGMDLTGTRLPEDISRWDGLAHVADGARRAAKLFTTFLLGCLLSVLVTLFGWFLEDPDFFAEASNYVLLPLAKEAKIPLEGFFWAMPLMLMALFFYFQIYMQRLWEPLSLLPAIFPDGTPLDKKATPWLPLGYLRAHVRLVRKKEDSPLEFDKGLLTRLQNLAIAGLLWGLVPATLAAFWWGYLHITGKTIPGAAWQGGLTLAALAVAFYFQALCRDTLRREPPPDPKATGWQRLKAYAGRHAFHLAWLGVALEYLVCLSILNWPA